MDDRDPRKSLRKRGPLKPGVAWVVLFCLAVSVIGSRSSFGGDGAAEAAAPAASADVSSPQGPPASENAVASRAAPTPGDSEGLPPQAARPGGFAREETRTLTVDELGGFLGAGYLFTKDRQTPEGIQKTEHQIQERAGLGIAGSVYSRNFLRYEGTGVLGLTQAWGDDGTESNFDTGNIVEFDTRLNFFPTRIHPANVYFLRTQDFRPRVFLSTLETTTTLARGEQALNLSDGHLLFSAERRRTEQKQLGLEGRAFLDVVESTLSASGDYRLTKRQTISGGYTFLDVDQDVDTLSFRSNNFDAYHTLRLSDTETSQLRSRFEARLQDGDLDQDFIRWTEALNSQLTSDLQLDGLFSYTASDSILGNLEELRGNVDLTHQLYESLTSSLGFQGSHTVTSDVSTTDALGSTLGLHYQKSTALGSLRMGYSGFLERRIVENGRGPVIDEAYTFPITPPEEVRLNQPRIDVNTLRVKDPSGLVIYIEGVDYTVRTEVSGFTFLTRLFTGNIPPGGDILVDYVYDIGADFTLDTWINNGRLEHEFTGGLTPYFVLHHQHQNLDEAPGATGVTPINELGLLGGLEWRRPTWLVGGEYESRESTILPFDAIRLRAQWSDQVLENGRLAVYANQTWFFYTDPERDTSVLQGAANWHMSLSRDTSFYLNCAVQRSDDSLQGAGFGVSFGGGLEYRWRGFSFRFRSTFRETHGTSSDFRGAEVGLWIVREFGSLPSSTDQAINRFLRQ